MRLSNLKEHLRSVRNLTRSRIVLRDTTDKVHAMDARMGALLARQQELLLNFDEARAENGRLREELSRMEAAYEQGIGTMAGELVRLEGMVGAHRRAFVEISRQLSVAPADTNEAPARAEMPDPFLDTFYREFEDKYRGSREEILLRLRPYMPHLEFLKKRGGKNRRIVDLGCGRGEWLEVLREHDLDGFGVDLNDAQAEAARELGLAVEIDDIINWLSRQKDRSIDFLSAFHLIEHLEFSVLLRLLKEAVRVIKPDGGLLLETPNPESMIVGAYKFWFDPTHVRPYPPELITQLLESLGFERVQVMRLHPDGRNADYRLQHGLAAPIADLLVGPLDYSVLCRRP